MHAYEIRLRKEHPEGKAGFYRPFAIVEADRLDNLASAIEHSIFAPTESLARFA